MCLGDFPGGPVVKTSPSNEGVIHSTPGQGVKSPQALHCGQKVKNNNNNNKLKKNDSCQFFKMYFRPK